LLGTAGLSHRRAADHELPPATDAAKVGRGHLPSSDPDPHRQARPGRELAGVQHLLHGQPAARGSGRHPSQIFIGRPQGKQRIPGELHHIAAVIHDQLDQLTETTVQQVGELLDTGRPGLYQPLGQCCEPRDVGEQGGGGELLTVGLAQWLMAAHKAPGREGRNITGERERLAAIPQPCPGRRLFHFLPSQPGKRTAQLLDLGIAVGPAKCNSHGSSPKGSGR